MNLPFSMLAQVGQEPPAFLSLLPIALMFLIFYFLLIRPQRRRQSKHETMIRNLNKNDEVVTSGGIHGTVVGLKEGSVTLRIAENVKIEVERSAVARVEKSRSEEAALPKSSSL
ncbi:MAG: preprotein translocase subunit YajC [Candidatus Omnitrophota bacterium]